MKRAVLLLAALALAGCLRPSTDVVAETNVQVVVTGALLGERVELVVGALERVLDAAPDEPVTFFLDLEAGTYPAEVRVGEGQTARCGAFTLEVDERETTRAVDALTLELCEPNELIELIERVVNPVCILELCEETTTVSGVGEISYEGAATLNGTLAPVDLSGIEAEVLAADALFAGDDPDCPQPPPGGLFEVELERTVRVAGELRTESVDVAGCDGAAARLRARLSLARELALGVELTLSE